MLFAALMTFVTLGNGLARLSEANGGWILLWGLLSLFAAFVCAMMTFSAARALWRR